MTYYIDGTNVCYWDNNDFSLNLILHLCAELKIKGYDFNCCFDANTVHKCNSREERDVYNALLTQRRKFQKTKADMRADTLVLFLANEWNASIISNDRFNSSEYLSRYPWVHRESSPQRLFKGLVYTREE